MVVATLTLDGTETVVTTAGAITSDDFVIEDTATIMHGVYARDFAGPQPIVSEAGLSSRKVGAMGLMVLAGVFTGFALIL